MSVILMRGMLDESIVITGFTILGILQVTFTVSYL